MDQFRSFDQLRVTELPVLRHGFWRPWYELTDGQFSYGKLTYTGALKRRCTIEVAGVIWMIKRRNWTSRKLIIEQPDGMEMGLITPEVWSRKVTLHLNNGLTATFYNKKIFSRTCTWVNEHLGDILNVETKVWSRKQPFIVKIDPDMIKKVPELPLLALLGINLVLLKQAEAAAAS
ncbi:hypothetical protein MTO98_20800 [Mucilaginibacter sp. SMC90]|uniref:hypothetical protein n=1 Tax=Mucilaginibacter sp. SMC90 TaxID=2929803 RepID=UPI001FB3F63E|nr:hypothetical protein [Mucilaginibacter sp. SMC90]UOE46845.1 hypothetical protein MTO98_20800 [Mucilaginibacter sp. SMC90]